MTSTSQTPLAIAQAFFEHWNEGRVDEAVAMLAEDVLYDNVPLPDIHGRAAVLAFHRDFGVGKTFSVQWSVTTMAADGNVVLNERVDRFVHTSGKEIVLPVMGTLTVVDGQITVWRDYFDLASFETQAAAIGV